MAEWIIEANDTEEAAEGKFAFIREVVRCKDCVFCWKFNDKYYLPRKDTLLCINDNTEVCEDDFCSWGERRDDGENTERERA